MSRFKIRISVRGLFFDDDGELVLIKSPNTDYWVTPGGGLEENETLTEAAERELLEETGFEGIAERPVLIRDFINHNGEKQLEIFFKGRITRKVTSKSEYLFKLFSEEEFKNIGFKPDFLNPFDLEGDVQYKALPK